MKLFLLLVFSVMVSTLTFSQSGTIDTDFNMAVGFNDAVRASAIDNDGKIYVGGEFTYVLGEAKDRIVRLNSDGSLDNTFVCSIDGTVRVIKINADGKIYVGGEFTTVNGQAAKRIARLNVDGSLDAIFDSSVGFDNAVYDIKILSNGRLLVGGDFNSYGNVTSKKVAKLLGNGSVDPDFIVGGGFDGRVNSIDYFSNGKIVVGGTITLYGSTTIGRIARLNENGSFDDTFTPLFNDYLTRVQVIAGDKIMAFGEYTTLNGQSQNRGVRLNYDGTKDNTFNIGTGFASIVQDFIAEPNGKIIAVGNFASFNGVNQKHIIRLNSNGSFDNTLTVGVSLSHPAVYVALQPDGKILAGGVFSMYQGIAATRFVRINNCIVSTNAVSLEKIIERVSVDEVRSKYTGTAYQWFSCDGTAISGATNRTLSNPGAGSYYVEVTTTCGVLKSTCLEVSCVSAPFTDVISTCYAPFTWINGMEYFSSATAIYLIPGAAVGGCDSLVHLNLAIEDIAAPVPSIAELPTLERICYLSPLPVPTAYDECSGVIEGQLHVYDSGTQGNQVVTWKYVDDAGNVSYQDQSVVTIALDYSLIVDGTTLSTANNVEGITYQWNRCDLGFLDIEGATSASYTATESGVYAVNFWVAGCEFSSDCYTITISDVGIEDQFTSFFSVYPNPTNGNITISFKVTEIKATIEVIDVLGKVVNVVTAQNVDKYSLALEGDAGIYSVRIVTDKGISTQRLSLSK